MQPCEDPLSSVAARETVDKSKGIFEAVNKESRSKYFVGMHNEQVRRACCFVCSEASPPPPSQRMSPRKYCGFPVSRKASP